MPLAFAGNGAGLPAAYLVATLLVLCFAVGYAAISRRVINTGAFYTYIARGIGRPPAIGAAMLAVAAYALNVAGIAGASGYFVRIVAEELGATSAGSGGRRAAAGPGRPVRLPVGAAVGQAARHAAWSWASSRCSCSTC